jgi:hypothetical protein
MTKHLSVNVTCHATKTTVSCDVVTYFLTVCKVAEEFAVSMLRVDLPQS